jgi:cysteine desulfurase
VCHCVEKNVEGMSSIYLDNHATTAVDPAVLDAMLPYFSERYGNASSKIHAFGQDAYAAVETARAWVARLIGATPEEIAFTSGATESNNLAIRGGGRSLAASGKHIVVTSIEHASVLESAATLEREGFAITRVGVGEQGLVDVGAVRDALRPDTVLVSVMAANNEIGTLQPIADVGALCRERGIAFHSDAVQALGRIPVDVQASSIDVLSLSAHKMYGPKGVGALFVSRSRRPRFKPQPQSEGGGQEKGLRSGTLNVPGIVGFGKAAELALEALASGEPERITELRDRLLSGLLASIDGVMVNGSMARRLPGNLNVSIERAEAETLILSLGGGIAISSGAACAEAGGKGSHVLRALGLSDARVYTALRFGVGRYNDESEVDRVVDSVAAAVRTARARSAPLLS